MARRRYITTDISADDRIAELADKGGPLALVLYTWMVPHAEDDATLRGTPRQIKLKVLPGVDCTAQDVEKALEVMLEIGLIEWDREHEVVGFPPESFYRYQTYIPPARRRTQSLAEYLRSSDKPSTNQRNSPQIAEEERKSAQKAASLSPSLSLSHSPTREGTTPAIAPPPGGTPDNAAVEAAVADETVTETEPPQQDQEAAEHSDESASIEAVYRHYCETWKDVFPRGPVLTPGRRRKLAARLKRWSAEELKRACDNMHANPFFRGDNDRGVAYGTLDYLIRSDENVDRLLTAPPRAAPAGKRAWQQFPESQERAAQEQEAVKRKVITL